MNIQVLLLMILTLCAARISAATARLVGGKDAPTHFGRFHASLQNFTGHHVCGGVIVSHHHIVTAAHCVLGAEPQYIKAVVGTTNLDYGGQHYDVSSIYIHDEYNITSRINDIAVIKVIGQFNLRYVDILTFYENELEEGDQVILSGFGAEMPNGESSRTMHVLNLPVFNQETCRYAMRYSREVTDTMFCTFTQIGEGTCHGDSGGPLIKNYQLVGLVSWGIPCAVGFPDVHTRIRPYVSWIEEQIK
ncbi:chymotrypsin-2-like isoform X1 [Ostrinia furnacalis]|uniref:chymotrypsin-2-like isoform X1 n=1 Tax=Ostrinia furnacalis TaxID=93504 RepID=UPI00103A0959|nr:chymotrypsin-2-like isoform X1 [Ostrinia furnacalis]